MLLAGHSNDFIRLNYAIHETLSDVYTNDKWKLPLNKWIMDWWNPLMTTVPTNIRRHLLHPDDTGDCNMDLDTRYQLYTYVLEWLTFIIEVFELHKFQNMTCVIVMMMSGWIWIYFGIVDLHNFITHSQCVELARPLIIVNHCEISMVLRHEVS